MMIVIYGLKNYNLFCLYTWPERQTIWYFCIIRQHTSFNFRFAVGFQFRLSNSLIQECCHLEFNYTGDTIMPALEGRKHHWAIYQKSNTFLWRRWISVRHWFMSHWNCYNQQITKRKKHKRDAKVLFIS